MAVLEMIRTHPRPPSAPPADALVRCIEECLACAQSCTACADACLGEDQRDSLVRCIRLNLDCADVCATTGTMLSRLIEPDWGLLRRQVELCAEACRICGDECRSHAGHHEHCRVCAEACRRCRESCEAVLRAA